MLNQYHINGTWLSCFLGSHFVAPDPAVNIQERYTHTCRLLNISCLRNITLPMEIVTFDILGHHFFWRIHIMVSSSGSCLLCIVMQYHRISFMHLNSLVFVTKNTGQDCWLELFPQLCICAGAAAARVHAIVKSCQGCSSLNSRVKPKLLLVDGWVCN